MNKAELLVKSQELFMGRLRPSQFEKYIEEYNELIESEIAKALHDLHEGREGNTIQILNHLLESL